MEVKLQRVKPMERRVFKMRRTILISLLLSVIVTFAVVNNARSSERPVFVPGEVLVKFADDMPIHRIEEIKSELGLQMIKHHKRIGVEHLRIVTPYSLDQVLRKLRESGLVEYAEPNYLRYINALPNDPSIPMLWGLDNTGQGGGTPDADIDAPEAWDITTGDPNFVVAVIDSGMDMLHPDLAANLWVNPGEIAGNSIDDDGNGYVDDVNGWDFSIGDNNPSDTASNCGGHGTHVSGTIGGVGNNGLGVAGVNWNVKIMPVKVFKNYLLIFCSASDTDIISAINYAADMGVLVSNNSYGGGPYNQALYDAIRASRSLYVVAAGNDGSNNDLTPSYPASYDLPNIVAVAATNNKDILASFSNYGVASVDIAAPGVSILSTLPGNNYAYYSGTSMATPHVVGSAALLWANDPAATVNEVKWRLLEGTDPKALPVLTGGRLNINNSLNLPAPWVTFDVIPVGSPTVPRGGTVSYDIHVRNHTGVLQVVKLSVVAQLPNGKEVPLDGPVTVTMSGGQIISLGYSKTVPTNAPVGDYTIFGRAEVTAQSYDEDAVVYAIY